MKLKVVGIESDEVFSNLAAGREVYAINPESDKLINLKYEAVSYVIDILAEGDYGYFVVYWSERS